MAYEDQKKLFKLYGVIFGFFLLETTIFYSQKLLSTFKISNRF